MNALIKKKEAALAAARPALEAQALFKCACAAACRARRCPCAAAATPMPCASVTDARMHAASASSRCSPFLPRRDFTIDVELVGGNIEPSLKPRVWRRLRVSGGIPLPTLVDKLLLPAMVSAERERSLPPHMRRRCALLRPAAAARGAAADSAAVPLPTLRPASLGLQGWERNYHGHVITDHREGAVFGDPQ